MAGSRIIQKYVAPTWGNPSILDEHKLYALTDHDINTLLALLVPAHWKTRWDNAPAADVLDAYIAELEDQLMSPLNICDLIEECDINACCREQRPGPLPDDWRDNPIVPQPGGCNLDALWASCDELVERLDQMVVDQLEKIEAATNIFELVGELLQGLPFSGGTILDEVTQTLTWFQDTIAESYVASVTTQVKDDLKCALFCTAKDDDLCAVSEKILFEELAALTAESFVGDDIFEFLAKLIGGTYTGGEIAYAAWMFIVGWGRFASIVPLLSSSYPQQLQRAVWAGYADPRGGWAALCSCPVTWAETIDFCADPFGTYFELAAGILQTGDCRVRGVFQGGNTNRVQVNLTLPAGTTLDRVGVTAYITSAGNERGIFLKSPPSAPAFDSETYTTSGERTEEFVISPSLENTVIQVLISGVLYDYCQLRSITFEGTGQNPFEL